MKETTSAQLVKVLPYLRRYARALTGSRSSGDNYAAITLEAVMADPELLSGASAPKLSVFRAFHEIWSSSGGQIDAEADPLRRAAQVHLSSLAQGSREALLLNSIEAFSPSEISTILGKSVDQVETLLDQARKDISQSVSGKVMIIEDETIIALDIQALVEEMGHTVTGTARTRAEAVELAAKDMPDLILADIKLADDSSGIDAVNEVMEVLGRCPVIFITAYPERLLSGERTEPAFLIAKPYSQDQIRSAVSQAMFFATTEAIAI